jgi:AraC family transcriptional regulator
MGATDLFLAVSARYPQARIARAGRLSGRRLQRAIDYIHAHLIGDVRLGDIATAAGLSVFHFARTFKKTTGLTPHAYLMKARVERAKELLLEYDKTLVEIASETGFSDQSHMSRVFRRFTGATPSEFRDGWSRPLTIPLLSRGVASLAGHSSPTDRVCRSRTSCSG